MKSKLKVLSVMAGVVLEQYDVMIYNIFAVQMASVFFAPQLNQESGLVLAFATFALSFLVRPIGGIAFGLVGDIWGRKKALLISLLAMSASTLAIAFLPTYEKLGVLAGILLLILRLVQGLCIGGEYAAGLTAMYEMAPAHQRNLYSSWVIAATPLGGALGIMTVLICGDFKLSYFSLEGWRVPFFLAGCLGFLSFTLRRHISETGVVHTKSSIETIKVRFGSLFRNLMAVPSCHLKGFCLGVAIVVPFYTLSVYIKEVLAGQAGFESIVTLNSLFVFIFFVLGNLIGGKINDQWGHLRVSGLGLLLVTLLSPVVFYVIGSSSSFVPILLAELALIFAHTLFSSSLATRLGELFSRETRMTGIAFGFTLGVAIFGGLTPLINHFLFRNYGLLGPSLFVALVTGGSFLCLSCYNNLFPALYEKAKLRET